MLLKPLLLAVITLFIFRSPHFSQMFLNGDLEGEVRNISDLPYGWSSISPYDPSCTADNIGNATPDLSDIDGASEYPGTCCIGNPYSGLTFMSGLLTHTGSNGPYHEGIEQTVSNFSIDSIYKISFYQTNVKQFSVASDTSGSWAVYVDDVLIGITEPSVSYLAPESTSLTWDFRSLSFVATSTKHTIKFIPADDDSLYWNTGYDEGLRMGIDYIYIGDSFPEANEERIIMSNVFTPNGDGVNDLFAPVYLEGIKSMHTTIFNRWGQVVYDTSDLYIQWDGKVKFDEEITEGVYFWKINGRLESGEVFNQQGAVTLLR